MSTPRGIRNNNPGNLRLTGDRWQGQVLPPPDPSFVTFRTPAYGYRALMRTLRTYMERYGLDTVEGIIHRWAPSSENDTTAYIRTVCRLVGYSPLTRLTPDKAVLTALAGAIARVETGVEPDPADIEAGYRLLTRK